VCRRAIHEFGKGGFEWGYGDQAVPQKVDTEGKKRGQLCSAIGTGKERRNHENGWETVVFGPSEWQHPPKGGGG